MFFLGEFSKLSGSSEELESQLTDPVSGALSRHALSRSVGCSLSSDWVGVVVEYSDALHLNASSARVPKYLDSYIPWL